MHSLLRHNAAGVPPGKLAVVSQTFEVPLVQGVLTNARQVPRTFCTITCDVVLDMADVHHVRNSGIDVAVVFSCFLASIWLLVTAVDTFLNRKATAVSLPNLTCRSPGNTD